MGKHNSEVNHQKKEEVAEQIWLDYFNQRLFEQGVITETERNRMQNKIASRRCLTKAG